MTITGAITNDDRWSHITSGVIGSGYARGAAHGRYPVRRGQIGRRDGAERGHAVQQIVLNPDCRHYTGLDEFIHILRHSQNLQPLQVLCRLFGGVFYRLPTLDCVSDSALLDIVNRVHAEGGDVHRAMSDALEDGVVTSDEFRNVDHELMDWIAAIIELRGRFRSLVVMPAGQEAAPCN